MKILDTYKLNKVFRITKEKVNYILKDIDLTVNTGVFLTVMGPSGSGKSTLMYNISGMDIPSSGNVFFNGRSITGLNDNEMSDMRLKEMGFVFQQSYLLKDLNIFDNVILPGLHAKKFSKPDVISRAKKIFDQLGISSLAERRINEASGGQLQRVNIARALINDPDILFCDEPTGALNSAAAEGVMDILNEINNKGTTVVMVTHDAKIAARTEKVLIMKDGIIATSLYLGKYDLKEDISAREIKLNNMLLEHNL